MISPEFFLTSLVVILIPGTGVIYTISNGLALRRRAGIVAAFGCTLGILPHLLVSILGMSAILHMSAQAFQVLKFVGSLYLLYLAWGMWRDTDALKLERKHQPLNAFQIALKGLLINILNPKLTIFFFAFLPPFVSADPVSSTQQMLVLGAVFMAMTFVVFTIYGVLAGELSEKVLNSSKTIKRMQRSFAAIFALLAFRLAFNEE